MELKKTGKQIVSKGEYVGRLGSKAFFSAVGIIMLWFCAIGVFATICLLFTLFFILYPDLTKMDVAIRFIIFLSLCLPLVGVVLFLLGYVGRLAIRRGRQVDPGIPFTRENTADLPAEDSLVRASEEPTPEQQTVLLRAAVQGQETPAEELVRASSGP